MIELSLYEKNVLQKIEYKPDADDERLRRLTLTKHLLAVMIPTAQTKVNFHEDAFGFSHI